MSHLDVSVDLKDIKRVIQWKNTGLQSSCVSPNCDKFTVCQTCPAERPSKTLNVESYI